jgi:cobalamin biosynthesis protein CobD/CbiB
MACAAPWHAGMAYALGYLRAALQTLSQTVGRDRSQSEQPLICSLIVEP